MIFKRFWCFQKHFVTIPLVKAQLRHNPLQKECEYQILNVYS